MSISSPSTIRSTKTIETSRTELRAREEAWRQTAYAKDQECRQKEAEYNYQYDRMKTVNDEAEWNAAMGRAAAEQEAARADEEAARAAKLEEELRAMKEKEARRRARRMTAVIWELLMAWMAWIEQQAAGDAMVCSYCDDGSAFVERQTVCLCPGFYLMDLS